jgi:hypothetical protein
MARHLLIMAGISSTTSHDLVSTPTHNARNRCIRRCSATALVPGRGQTTHYSCESAPEEQERDTRYTGASLPESEDWIE